MISEGGSQNFETKPLDALDQENKKTNTIDDDYEAFMNSDNDLLAGENDDNLTTLEVNENEKHTIVLLQGDEWVIDLRNDQTLYINIVNGICEIFGIELVNGSEYVFNSHDKMVLFAVEGCEIVYRTNKTLLKKFPDCIIKNDPNIIALYSIALKLAQRRLGNLKGPRVLIIGDQKSGKTSIAKTLLSYAVKMITSSNSPIFVNLDPSKGIFTLPGPISATVVDDSLQVDSPIWGESTTSSMYSLVPTFEPIVKQFGFESINEYNRDFYLKQVDSLAEDVSLLLNKSFHSNRTGIIVDTPEFKLQEDIFSLNEKSENDVSNEAELKQEDAITPKLEETEQQVVVQQPEDDLKETTRNRNSDYESEYEDDDLQIPELPIINKPESLKTEESDDDVYFLPEVNNKQLIDLPYDVEFIGRLVEKFEIDHIIDVVNADGQEDVNNYLTKRLFSLSSRVNKAFIFPVVKPSSIELENITESFKRHIQRLAIKSYFYGSTSKFSLSPYTTTVRYEDVSIFKHSELDCNTLVKIEQITKDLLQYSVLAVTNSDLKEQDSESLIKSGIMGYVIVLQVLDASNKQMLKILSPTMGDLPRRAMLLSEFKYYE